MKKFYPVWEKGEILVSPKGEIINENDQAILYWLDSNKSFRYKSDYGLIGLTKDKNGYWTGQKRWNNFLRRKRIGFSEEISELRLQHIAWILCSLEGWGQHLREVQEAREEKIKLSKSKFDRLLAQLEEQKQELIKLKKENADLRETIELKLKKQELYN